MDSATDSISPENKDNKRSLRYKQITERDTAILERFQKGETLQEIGNDIGLSRERIRQITNATIKRFAINESLSKGIIIDAEIFGESISRKRQLAKDARKPAPEPPKKPKEYRWSMYYTACRKCGTTKIPHVRKGFCEGCEGSFRAERREEIIQEHENKCDSCGKRRADARVDYGRDFFITKNRKVLCLHCFRNTSGKILGSYSNYEWSRFYPACKSCGTTTVPHVKQGLCENCSSTYSERQREDIIKKHSNRCDLCNINRETAQKKYDRDLFATKKKEVYCWGCFLKTARSRFLKE